MLGRGSGTARALIASSLCGGEGQKLWVQQGKPAAGVGPGCSYPRSGQYLASSEMLCRDDAVMLELRMLLSMQLGHTVPTSHCSARNGV